MSPTDAFISSAWQTHTHTNILTYVITQKLCSYTSNFLKQSFAPVTQTPALSHSYKASTKLTLYLTQMSKHVFCTSQTDVALLLSLCDHCCPNSLLPHLSHCADHQHTLSLLHTRLPLKPLYCHNFCCFKLPHNFLWVYTSQTHECTQGQ